MNTQKGVEKTEVGEGGKNRKTEPRQRGMEEEKAREWQTSKEEPGEGRQMVLTAGRRAVSAVQFCPGEAVPGTGCEQR